MARIHSFKEVQMEAAKGPGYEMSDYNRVEVVEKQALEAISANQKV